MTEEVWPGARVSRASYVVSMLQPKVVSDLRLRDYGYRAVPLDPAYAALTERRPDLLLQRAGADRGLDRAASPSATPRPTRTSRTCSTAPPRFLRPMMLREPPALGSRHPGDLLSLLREGGARRRPQPPRRPRPGPHLHDVGRRPARRLVRARRAQGLDRLDRRGRRLGRPAHAGHRLQPAPPRARRDRRDRGRLGPGDRRHGRDQPGDRRAPPRRRAPRSAPAPRSPRSTSATAARSASRSPTARRSARRSSPRARTRRRRSSTSPAPSTSPTRSPRTCAATAPAAAR